MPPPHPALKAAQPWPPGQPSLPAQPPPVSVQSGPKAILKVRALSLTPDSPMVRTA